VPKSPKPRIKSVMFRLTEEDHKRALKRAGELGHQTISEYFRSLGQDDFRRGPRTDELVSEFLEAICRVPAEKLKPLGKLLIGLLS
jgi:hypothetical protein